MREANVDAFINDRDSTPVCVVGPSVSQSTCLSHSRHLRLRSLPRQSERAGVSREREREREGSDGHARERREKNRGPRVSFAVSGENKRRPINSHPRLTTAPLCAGAENEFGNDRNTALRLCSEKDVCFFFF